MKEDIKMIALPEILTEKKYENTWEWDGWKPKAKADAPQVVKDAIDTFVSESDSEEDGGTIVYR